MPSCCWRRCWNWPPTTAWRASEYAETLIELHRYAQAREQLEQLIREEPDSRLRLQGLYATASVGLGEHERAITLYRELLSGIPADADVHLSIAHAQKTLGRPEEAIESYRQAARQPRGLRRRVLEPCEPQDLPLHRRRRWRGCAR